MTCFLLVRAVVVEAAVEAAVEVLVVAEVEEVVVVVAEEEDLVVEVVVASAILSLSAITAAIERGLARRLPAAALGGAPKLLFGTCG